MASWMDVDWRQAFQSARRISIHSSSLFRRWKTLSFSFARKNRIHCYGEEIYFIGNRTIRRLNFSSGDLEVVKRLKSPYRWTYWEENRVHYNKHLIDVHWFDLATKKTDEKIPNGSGEWERHDPTPNWLVAKQFFQVNSEGILRGHSFTQPNPTWVIMADLDGWPPSRELVGVGASDGRLVFLMSDGTGVLELWVIY